VTILCCGWHELGHGGGAGLVMKRHEHGTEGDSLSSAALQPPLAVGAAADASSWFETHVMLHTLGGWTSHPHITQGLCWDHDTGR
jgi:hypothetical protein